MAKRLLVEVYKVSEVLHPSPNAKIHQTMCPWLAQHFVNNKLSYEYTELAMNTSYDQLSNLF